MRAPSPTYFCTSSLPMTRMKHASVRFATARADSVLPVPGGPKSRMPLGGSMPRVTNFSGWRRGSSTTSLSFSSASLLPPTSLYVTSGFSSTCIIVTVGSILGGSGIWIWYLVRSTPTRIPSSISVGATRSPSPTTNLAICLTLIMYFASSCPALRILVQRATCSGCSCCIISLSATTSHMLGGASPVSLSLTPLMSLTRLFILEMSFSMSLIADV
mmetsp:Transcript_39168/g.76584  ORF Transcript_39168/g.76584 Transcript_39168/m.76584 type:complete len:216 (+) Transcript_39168:902-1549(+)